MASLATKPLHCPQCSAVVLEASKLSYREDRLLENLAKNKFPTLLEAAKDAGYADSSARKYISTALGRPRLVAALEQKKNGRLDKARGILDKSQRVVDRKLDQDQDGEFALRAMAVSATVVEKNLEEDTDTDPQVHIDRVRRMVREAMLAGLRCGLDRPHLADSILQRHGDAARVVDCSEASVVEQGDST